MHENKVAAHFRADLARWRQLVAPAWLAALTAGKAVAAPPAAGWRLFEVGCGGAALFERSHIPGASYLDTGEFESGPLWNKVDDDVLSSLLLSHGVRHDTTVILYGRNNLAAARLAHLLLYAGVADVRLLDGGFALWQAGGHPCAGGPCGRRPERAVAGFAIAFPAHPAYLIGTGQARALLTRPDGALVSIRSEAEFLGKVSGYSYIAARGDIPGARWGRAGVDGDVNSMSAYHLADGRMKPAAGIVEQWREQGITQGMRLGFYCGTGWRASMAFFYAWLMDWPHISVYDGGWLEWSGGCRALLETRRAD
ncbi:thiosulfate/3-mercaptopyruvate sulfurtransferase [Duganella sp. 1411]|uniref:sulfurtransferase n=1 Tax=Duganella sp. 1411 TaxID=2806572 RepID=UPI001AE5BFF5|nr:rhodanese-like domain-containing protein [Duganella sp. 1411]MBP1204756.1 thiosulfate/3-mercaptopyruvate sulfurtransferase [Duganella sp. 1411]